MGYTTDFKGAFAVTPPLDAEMIEYLKKFAGTRRMKRDVETIKAIFPNWQDLCAGGILGEEGEYFVGGGGYAGQDHDDSVMDYNYPPTTQPGLWCQWVPSEDGRFIEWDYGEKFYNYTEWLEYLIFNFLEPNGYMLNGTVEWYGEDSTDIGRIVVTDNDVDIQFGEITYH